MEVLEFVHFKACRSVSPGLRITAPEEPGNIARGERLLRTPGVGCP